ncbi:MAG TPA: serine hydrolase domain-containing protein [Saprospiraceae bacterium]|nr:serine hydrolase domain-containing protein [Saprospiraceae bacterium]
MKALILLPIFLSAQIICAQPQAVTNDRLEILDQYLSKQEGLSGIFMIANSEKIIYNKGFGYSDRANKVPYSDQTLFTIGSITKPFTATAIMLLMENGKIKTDQFITDFFENVPKNKSGITVHHLLTHSSGLPGAIGDDYEAISAEEFQNRAWQQQLLFSPGEGYEYSNVGYSLLGMIVEKLSGEKYNDFLLKHIFSTAGMTTAGYTNANADYTRLAHGYLPDGTDTGTSKNKLWNGDEPYWHLKSNGGLLMSSKDMYQWYLALRNNKVLKPETLKIQLTPYVDEGGGSHYGYGYAVTPGSVQHNGGNRIFKADFRWFPEKDYFFFSASNDANVKLFRINDEILRILEGEKPAEPTTWITMSEEDFLKKDYYGTVSSFMKVLKEFSLAAITTFIDQHCSPEIIERNGREKLIQVFERVSGDTGKNKADGISYSSSETNRIMLTYPGPEHNSKLKITMNIIDSKYIEKLNVEMEGM